jgi:serine/threonine-protein kinase
VTLGSGSRIGGYEITAKLGEGGMGEVYRATDTRLRRDVAVKVLPSAFTSDKDRLVRFEREAQLLASLNHPNIAHVYGFESAPLPDGSSGHFLAMELVAGEDLAERLKRGPIHVDEAVVIAKQIAEALEEAHERGIIHRDLKPANVKVTSDGKVKVLDFGLAKALDPGPQRPFANGPDVANSPTLAYSGTQAGLILGTAAYMSPEQARGTPADRRADIWAFGVVLYEMLTGRRLFDGEMASDVLASVLKSDPAWSDLPRGTPGSIRSLLRRCLERTPKNRLHDIADARIVLEDAIAGRNEDVPAAAPALPKPRRVRLALWIAGIVGALALGLLAGWQLGGRNASTETEMRFLLGLPPGWKLADADTMLLAISPDGRRRVVAAANEDGRDSLLLGEIGSVEWRELPGTEGARSPFFSPDGQWIGYFGEGVLLRVAFDGGPPVPIVGKTGAQTRGAAWLVDGSIVYTPDAATPLLRVSMHGGEPKNLTTLRKETRDRTHRWPAVLPDGSAVLFTSDSIDTTEYYDDAVIEAVIVATGERKTVLRGSSRAAYVDPGILVFARSGSLFATRFDPKSLEVKGSPVPVLERVGTIVASGAAQFALSAKGDLLWAPGDPSDVAGGRPVWVDRRGVRSAPLIRDGTFNQLDLSPDGRKLALTVIEGDKSDIWIVDVEKGARSRFTFEGDASDPTWSPDGKRILYVRKGTAVGSGADLFWKPSDGSGEAEALVVGPDAIFGGSLSPDGRTVIYEVQAAGSSDVELWTMPLEGERTQRLFFTNPSAADWGPRISPNGRFATYISGTSGRNEVFVRSFPSGSGVWQISTHGGLEPKWSRDGRELYFRDRGVLYRVPVETGGAFSFGTPERIGAGFRSGENMRSYSPAPDGLKFATLPGWEVVERASLLNLALGWHLDVRRRLSPER